MLDQWTITHDILFKTICVMPPCANVFLVVTVWSVYTNGFYPFPRWHLDHLLVSVGDRGVLPTRPRNRRGYALLAHTLGKMRSFATGERSNTEIRTVELKIQLYRRNCFRSQVHPTQLVPTKCFRSYVHPTQSLQGKRFRSQVHHT